MVVLTVTTVSSYVSNNDTYITATTASRTETLNMNRGYFHFNEIGLRYPPIKMDDYTLFRCANGSLIRGTERGELADWDSKNGSLKHQVLTKDPICVTDLLITLKSDEVSTLVTNNRFYTTLPMNFGDVAWPYPVSAYSSQHCGFNAGYIGECNQIIK